MSSSTPSGLKGPQGEYERSINSSLQSEESGSYMEEIEPSVCSVDQFDGDRQEIGSDSERLSGFSN